MNNNDTTHTSSDNESSLQQAIQLTEFHTTIEKDSTRYHPGDDDTLYVALSFTAFYPRKSQLANELLAAVIMAHPNEIIVWINEETEKRKVQSLST